MFEGIILEFNYSVKMKKTTETYFYLDGGWKHHIAI